MNKLAAAALSILCASANMPGALSAPVKAPAATTSPKAFVQSFYDWYVFRKDNEPDVRGTESVLKQKKQLLDAVLYKELSEDEAAAQKSPGEIVGLDFDPFVAANGLIYDKYQTGNAISSGGKYRVPVFGIEAGKKTDKPVLEAEVCSRNGRCVFTNFHYGKSKFPENENLLSVLAALKKERASTASK